MTFRAVHVKNGLAVQVIKPVDPAGISQVDEPPATLIAAAQTEAMEAIHELLAVLPS